MIFYFLIVLYAVAALSLVAGASRHDSPLVPARIFLAVAMAGWSVLYVLVGFDLGSRMIRHDLGRWLHVPTAIAVIHIAWARRELIKARNGRSGTTSNGET